MEMELTNSCSICFEDFTDRETAKPDVCDHVFCLQCLQKWGKHGSFCPIDRKRFRKIINLSTSTQIPIKPKKRKKERVLYDVSSHCEVCSKVQNNDTLVLCDCCDLGYHLACLTPPLSEVPPGIWHCPVCAAVAEKLKSKKGITKVVEDIVRNHTNLGVPTSSENSSSETHLANNKPSYSASNTNYSKRKTGLNIKKRERSNTQTSLFKRRHVRRTRSFHDNGTTSDASNENIDKLRSLRPRHQVGQKRLFDWCFSSDESQSLTSNDSDSSTKLQNHSKKSSRVRSLRPRNPLRKRIVCDNSNDSSDTSYILHSQVSEQGKSSAKSTTSTEQPNDLIPTSPNLNFFGSETSTKQENNNIGAMSETFPVTCIANKAISVATVVSAETQSYEANDLMNSNICIITSACCLKNLDNPDFDAINNTEISTDASAPASSDKKFPIFRSYPSEIVEDDEEISVIATVVNDRSFEKPIAKEKLPNSSLNLVNEHSSEDDLPDLGQLLFDAKNNKLNVVQKATSSEIFSHGKVKPVFSVFEKLEDEDFAQKKYSELNKAVKKIHPNKKDSVVIVKKELSNSFKLCSKNTSEINSSNFSKTNALSKELRAIEKEKWNRHHLQSENSCRPSHKLRCCKRYGKNHYKPSDVVHIGKYYCQKKYSDNYKELSAISKSLWQKPKWGEKDIVILNSLKKNVQTCSKVDPKTVDSCNIQYSGIPNHPTSSTQASALGKNFHHEIISFDTENFFGITKTQTKLVRSTLCLSNIKHLNVQKDGLICLNWQKQQV